MALTPDPVVVRAAAELRERPADAQWTGLSATIVSAVQHAARHTWPLDAAYPAGGAARSGDTLRISDQVVKAALHRALAGYHGAYLTRVDLDVDQHRCTGARLTVTCRYGDVLPTIGNRLAHLAADNLTEQLGTPIAAGDITVHIDDVDVGPLHQLSDR